MPADAPILLLEVEVCDYFNWSEGNPLVYMFRFILLGEGDTAPVTREVIRGALADAGHALAIWEPRCAHCLEGDADDATRSL